MDKAKVYGRGEAEEMYSPLDANDVVEELFKSSSTPINFSQFNNTFGCPTGCEKDKKSWMGVFIASIALNFLLLTLAAMGTWAISMKESKVAGRFFENIKNFGEEELTKQK
ncbi:unnamed protein product, partial [Mesorhabditis spiculigera]